MKLDMRKKQEKKETTKSTKKLPMTAKMKRAMAVYIAMVLIMTGNHVPGIYGLIKFVRLRWNNKNNNQQSPLE